MGIMQELLWIAVSFLFGSLPLSVWIGRVVLGIDIRNYGDGNPGAANVWRIGGAGWGALAVLLDFLKGAAPVAMANFVFEMEGAALAAAAIAPIAGHAFSPFLGFQGGKALAVTFGVWTGLTLWLIPTLLGLFFGVYLAVLKPDGWAVMAGVFSLLVVLLIIGNPLWLVVWVGMALFLSWMQRTDLARKPQLRFQFKKAEERE
jgi:glycerol-3-phosphate acyltransferase PlsY